MEKKKVILDCDPGHDDAFAIMLAVQHLDVLGITTIGGNCTLENVTKNALKVLEVLGRTDIPVYPGNSGPMVVPLVTAPQFHWLSPDWTVRASGACGKASEQARSRFHHRHRYEYR